MPGPELPNVDADSLRRPDLAQLLPAERATHPPRILLLYGSVRERSYSRFATFEAERLLRHFGCETRVFHANGLPLPDAVREAQAYTWETLNHAFRPGMGQAIPDRLFWARGEAPAEDDPAGAPDGLA